MGEVCVSVYLLCAYINIIIPKILLQSFVLQSKALCQEEKVRLEEVQTKKKHRRRQK